jgi:hypothetical protein
MMSKIIKGISVFSLWLAGLIFTAHLLIPHDHCLPDSFTTNEGSSPFSHGKTSHNSGFPVHCHAFNDLVSEKANIYVLLKNVQSDDMSTGCYPDIFTDKVHVFGIIIPDIQKPFPDSFLLELSVLRAPPSLG